MIIFYKSHIEWPDWDEFTLLEKIWFWLVVVAAILVVISGVLMITGITAKPMVWSLIGGCIMNVIMFILCGTQKLK